MTNLVESFRKIAKDEAGAGEWLVILASYKTSANIAIIVEIMHAFDPKHQSINRTWLLLIF